jgi:acetyltransferase-like isoleucine patch superfamily enzyme
MSKKRTLKELMKGILGRVLHHIARHGFPSKFRVFCHRLRGVKIGKNVHIGMDVHIDDENPSLVTIENNAFVTTGCMLLTHQRNLKEYKYGKWIGDCSFIKKPILIKEGVHIGIMSVIMPGVTIGMGAIIGAHSLVNKDIPDYCVAVGSPAKIIKNFTNENLD